MLPSNQALHANLTHPYRFVLGGPNIGACNLNYDKIDKVVTLSTGWSLCGKKIKIKAKNGKDTIAKVVGKCDSIRGGVWLLE